jgi:hypothetical protein
MLPRTLPRIAIHALFPILLLVASSTASRAATATWSNAAGGNWSTPGNWNGGAGPAPMAGDDVVITLAGTYTVTLDASPSLNTLTLGGASGVQILAGNGRTLTLANASTINANGVMNQTSFTLNGAGLLTVSGTCVIGSGTVAAAIADQGQYTIRGTVSQSGALSIASGADLRIEGDGSFSPATLTVANGFTNNGTIDLTSVTTASTATLAVTTGTLTNAAGKSINVLPGVGGARSLNVALDNSGTLSLGAALTMSRSSSVDVNESTGLVDVSGGDLTLTQSGTSPSFTNNGTVTLGSGRTWSVTTGGLTLASGSTLGGTGTLVVSSVTVTLQTGLSNSTITFQPSNSTINGPGTLTAVALKTMTLVSTTVAAPIDIAGQVTWRGNCAQNGTVTSEPGSNLRLEADGGFSPATLTVLNGFTNNGTIDMTSVNVASTATLAVTNGLLTNAATRTINVLAGIGGARTLNAALDNSGTLSLGAALTMSRSSSVHVNESTGLVDVSGGDLTLTQTGTNPSFTNNGTVTLGSGRTWSVTTGGLTLASGSTLGGTGTLVVSSGTVTLQTGLSNSTITFQPSNSTINGPGTLTAVTLKTMTLVSTTVAAPIDIAGQMTWRGNCAQNGTVTSEPGSNLRVEADGSFSPGTLTVQNGFTNNGTIDLTSVTTTSPTTLAVTNGLLTNAATRTINLLAGVGGNRSLNVALDNFGTVTVAAPTTMSRVNSAHVNEAGGTIDATAANLTVTQSGVSASFATSGTLTIGATRTVTVTNNTFTYAAGSLGGAGTLALSNVTSGNFNLAHTLGGLTLSSSTATFQTNQTTASTNYTLTSSTLNGPGTFTVATGKPQLITGCTVNMVMDNQDHVTWRGNNAQNGTLTSEPGSNLRVEADGSFSPGTLTVQNGFTNNGSIDLTSVNVTSPATLAITNGLLTNAATRTINVLAGVGGTRSLNVALDNFGTVAVGTPTTMNRTNSADVNEVGGTIDATAANLTVSQNGASASFATSGTLTIGATHTVTVTNGTFTYAAGSLGGAGTLVLSSVTSGNFNVAHTLGGLTLSSSTATFQTNQTTASTNYTLTSSTLNGPGTFTVATGKPQVIASCTVNMAVDNQDHLTWRGNNAQNGTLTSEPGTDLRVEGDGTFSPATLTVQNGFTNNGSIDLTCVNTATSATLAVTNGLLTNPATRTINVLAGVGGARAMNVAFDNSGTVTVGAATTMNRANSADVNEAGGLIDATAANLTVTQSGGSPSFVNNGTLTIGAGRTVSITNGSTSNGVSGLIQGSGTLVVSPSPFANAGTLSPGSSPGVLSITGSVVEASTALISIELGGTTVGSGYDRLAISGSETTAGTLAVTLISGFMPSAGDQFRVVTDAGNSGMLDHITGLSLGNGLELEPRRDAGGLTLVAVGQTWYHLDPASGTPPGVESHSAVYNDGSNRMIVFGGRTDAGVTAATWVASGANGTAGRPVWTALSPGAGPTAREGHSAVLDVANDRMIVYGGDDGAGTPTTFGDVWVLTNADGLGGSPAWVPLAPTGGPPPVRTRHTAVYDAADNEMIVFGGNPDASACATGLNDVWVLTHANGLGGAPAWVSLAPTGTPPVGRRAHNVGYDPATDRMIVFGGDEDCTTSDNQLWKLDHASGLGGTPAWTSLSATGAPPAPWSLHSGVYDPALDRFTAFGGAVTATRTDTVMTASGALGGSPMWVNLSVTAFHPPARTLHSAVLDAAHHRMIVFAGLGNSGRLSDTWVLTTDQGHVLDVPPVRAPSAPLFTGFDRPVTPNPARGTASFSIALDREQHVRITVYDLAGRSVRVLESGVLPAGEYPLAWDGRAEDGRSAGAGVFFLRLVTDHATQTRRIVMLR